jgi:hypothetical protein
MLPIDEEVIQTEDQPIETVPDEAPPPLSVPETPPQAPASIDIAQILKESRLDPNVLAQAIAQANAQTLAPLMPKPPESPKPWENDDFLENPMVFRQALSAWQEHNLKQFEQNKLSPLIQELQAIKNILPTLYARSAENPNFGAIQQRANELVSEYGIPHMTALAMAQKEIIKTAAVKINTPPKHTSTPDTRQSALTDTDELPNGPTTFREIIKGLSATGKYKL